MVNLDAINFCSDQVHDRYLKPVPDKPNDSPVNFMVLTTDIFELEPGTAAQCTPYTAFKQVRAGADFLTIYDGEFYNATKVLWTNNHERIVDGVLTGDGVS